jgi:hypothetical protein
MFRLSLEWNCIAADMDYFSAFASGMLHKIAHYMRIDTQYTSVTENLLVLIKFQA